MRMLVSASQCGAACRITSMRLNAGAGFTACGPALPAGPAGRRRLRAGMPAPQKTGGNLAALHMTVPYRSSIIGKIYALHLWVILASAEGDWMTKALGFALAAACCAANTPAQQPSAEVSYFREIRPVIQR